MKRLAALFLVALPAAGCEMRYTPPAVPAAAAPVSAPQSAAPSASPAPPPAPETPMPSKPEPTSDEKIVRTEEEWKRVLTPEQYRILRQKGTERPGSGEYEHTTTAGTYTCAACGETLFRSEGKFDSGCGWPAFDRPAEGVKITETRDTTHGMVRVEVTCPRCDGHLGHVFDDGPTDTGQRYCINSVSIKLKPDAEK